jgi:hypothetical protein
VNRLLFTDDNLMFIRACVDAAKDTNIFGGLLSCLWSISAIHFQQGMCPEYLHGEIKATLDVAKESLSER